MQTKIEIKKASEIEKQSLLKAKDRVISNFKTVKINFDFKHKEKVSAVYIQHNNGAPINNSVFHLKNGGHIGFTKMNNEWFYQFKDYFADKGFFSSGEWYSFGKNLAPAFDEVMEILISMQHGSVCR